MNLFRLLPRRLRRRMFLYTPPGFPDVPSCGVFYDARTTVFAGEDMMTLEYSAAAAQRRLFDRATRLLPPEGRILDLGCGLGHLLEYLEERKLAREHYWGVDVSERMVAEAARRYGQRFEQRNILEAPFEEAQFDTGYILNVLGYPIGKDPAAAMLEIVGRTFAACRVGIVLSHLAAGRKEGLRFTTVPEDLASRCEKAFGARTAIDDDGAEPTYLLALRHRSS